MELYLVQHAAAVPEEEDPRRPLAEEGRRTAQRVAAFAKAAGVRITQIWHSGKLRARETAEIFAAQLGPARGMHERPGLTPLDDVHPVALQLTEYQENLMVVGHLPHLSRLSSYLLCDDENKQLIQFQMAGIVCCKRVENHKWVLAWMIIPQILPTSESQSAWETV